MFVTTKTFQEKSERVRQGATRAALFLISYSALNDLSWRSATVVRVGAFTPSFLRVSSRFCKRRSRADAPTIHIKPFQVRRTPASRGSLSFRQVAERQVGVLATQDMASKQD
jgi:hypothetical protein